MGPSWRDIAAGRLTASSYLSRVLYGKLPGGSGNARPIIANLAGKARECFPPPAGSVAHPGGFPGLQRVVGPPPVMGCGVTVVSSCQYREDALMLR